jgi:hypothetical protein
MASKTITKTVRGWLGNSDTLESAIRDAQEHLVDGADMEEALCLSVDGLKKWVDPDDRPAKKVILAASLTITCEDA